MLIGPGLTGSIGAIHANRLSTHLHTSLSSKRHSHPHTQSHHSVSGSGSGSGSGHTPSKGLTSAQGMITLFVLSYPVMGCFYAFVSSVGWIDVSLGIWGWLGFSVTVSSYSNPL